MEWSGVKKGWSGVVWKGWIGSGVKQGGIGWSIV